MIGYGLQIRHGKTFFVYVLAARRMLEASVHGYALPYPFAGVLPKLAHDRLGVPLAFLAAGWARKQKR